MFRIAICEDDEEIHRLLHSYFLRFSVDSQYEFEIRHFSSAEELLLHYDEKGSHFFHALFLNEELSGMNGLETAHRIRSLPDLNVQIIFLTSCPKYMLDSFDVQIFQYLIEPIGYTLFREKVTMLCHHILSSVHRFLTIKINQEQFVLRTSDVIALVKIKHALYQNKVEITTTQQTAPFVVTGTLMEYTDKLDHSSFMLIHRSIIVNLEHIRKFTATTVVMSNQVEFPIGRSQAKQLREIYSHHLLL